MGLLKSLVGKHRDFSYWIIEARFNRVASVTMPFDEIVPDPELRNQMIKDRGGKIPGAFLGIMQPGIIIEQDNPETQRLIASIDESLGQLALQAK